MAEAETINCPDDAPADVAAPPQPPVDYEEDLRDFDQQTTPQPEPAADSAQGPEFDQLMQELIGPSQDALNEQAKNQELQGQINSLRQQEWERAEKQAFSEWSDQLQKLCGVNVPDDYARSQLLAMYAERPELINYWRYRHATADQRQAAGREFQQLERLYDSTRQAPDSPEKAQALRQIEARGQELQFMMGAHKMLNQAWNEVRTRASKVPPPMTADDIETTQVRGEISQILRGASKPVNATEPPPNFGAMSDNEYRNFIRKEYGISGF